MLLEIVYYFGNSEEIFKEKIEISTKNYGRKFTILFVLQSCCDSKISFFTKTCVLGQIRAYCFQNDYNICLISYI